MNTLTKQYLLTPAAGKRLIGKAIPHHPAIRSALQSGIIAILAGTTNGYVAEELLAHLGQTGNFSKARFFRGVTLPPVKPTTQSDRLPDESRFPGDVVLKDGVWQAGKTIFDVVDDLKEGDIVLKGANALNLDSQKAGIYIGHPKAGTIGAALQAVIGRRVRLILPIGLEKRVSGDIDALAQRLNTPGAHGPRLFPVSGEIITEIEAIAMLTNACAELVAAGGIAGAEGSCWLAITGTEQQIEQVDSVVKTVSCEPLFDLA